MTQRRPLSKKLRFEVFKRDGFACQYCGATPPGAVLHIDHIIAVASGGTNDPDNLVTSCEPCNLGKGARDLKAVPQSLAEKASEVAEREEQLRGYQEVMQARRDRLDANTWSVIGVLRPGQESVPRAEFSSVRMFVDRLGLASVLDAAEIAAYAPISSISRRFRYFCGICWNRIREQ